MAPDERFKKYQDAGADFLETARARAEEFLRELSKVSDSRQRQAQGAMDDLVESSRKGSEQLFATIRREVTSQLSALGLATKDDLAALERRLSARASATKTSATKAPAKKAAPARSATTKKAATKKAPAKTTAAKKAGGRA